MLICVVFFWYCFVNDTSTTEIYTYLPTLSLHDALPILACAVWAAAWPFYRFMLPVFPVLFVLAAIGLLRAPMAGGPAVRRAVVLLAGLGGLVTTEIGRAHV